MKSRNKLSTAALQIRAKEADAERLLTGPFATTRRLIMELFLAGKTSMEIAQSLNGAWPLENDISDELKAGVIRAALLTLATPEQRALMRSVKHSNRALRDHSAQNEGRDKVLRAKGMKVWTTEEKEYFAGLLQTDAYLRAETKQTRRKQTRARRKHYNHVRLAEEMNRRFETSEFTPERTMSRLDQIRAQERVKDPEARLSKLRANVLRKLDQAVGVTPLVVVPAEGLDEAAAAGGLHLGELRVDDAAMAVPDDVLEDDRSALDA